MNEHCLSVLIVDDEEPIRDSCQKMITLLGHEAEMAMDGIEALVKVSKNHFDLILTDLKMPGLTGPDLLAEVKKESPSTEVIIMTGYGSIEDAVNAMKLGASDFILKPLHMRQIAMLLNRSQERLKATLENSELRLLNEKLRSLNEAKSKFLALTSHELRTPLFVLNGNLQRLKKSLGAAELPDQEIMLDRTLNASTDLIRIVERICTLSAFETGNAKLELGTHGVAEFLHQPVEEVRRYASRRNQRIELDVTPEGLTIDCDAGLLSQAVFEVLMNAVKYTPDGGRIKVSISREDEGGRGYLTIRVQDPGIGIPAPDRQRVFDSFYESGDIRYHTSSKYEFKGGGMGIGLAIARNILEAHKGGIEVSCDEGRGTIVVMRVPQRQETAVKAKGRPAAGSSSLM